MSNHQESLVFNLSKTLLILLKALRQDKNLQTKSFHDSDKLFLCATLTTLTCKRDTNNVCEMFSGRKKSLHKQKTPQKCWHVIQHYVAMFDVMLMMRKRKSDWTLQQHPFYLNATRLCVYQAMFFDTFLRIICNLKR